LLGEWDRGWFAELCSAELCRRPPLMWLRLLLLLLHLSRLGNPFSQVRHYYLLILYRLGCKKCRRVI
jgi:hypothetical protein